MIVSTWTGVEVRALRTVALQLTQEQFAERLGFRPPTIRKWERATLDRPVRGDSAAALDVELSRLTDEQRARFRMTVTPREPSHLTVPDPMTPFLIGDSLNRDGELNTYGIEDEVKRREFGLLVGAAALAAASDSPWASIHIGSSDAQRLVQRVAELSDRDQSIGGDGLVAEAVAELSVAKQRLETATFSDRSGRMFMSAAGEMAVLAGWLAYDADKHSLASRCYADAFALANQAGDDDLTVHACLNAAHQSIALSRLGKANPHRVLGHLDRARQLTRGRPPGRIHALIAIREALACAILQDRTGFGRGVTTAWRELESAHAYEPFDECPPWLRFVNATEIRGHESHGLSDMGETGKALKLLVNDESLDTTRARNRVNYRAWLAVAYGQEGDTSSALTEGLSILDELEQSVSSPRTLRLLSPVRTASESHHHNEFAQRYDALRLQSAGSL